jgi:hypothetical protein
MFTRVKTIFVILILLFNLLIIGNNFGFIATNPENVMNRGSGSRSNGLDWSQVEVISEPLPFQNNNTGFSQSVSIAAENGKIYVVWQDGSDYKGAGSGDWDVFYRYFDGSSWSEIQVISEPVPGQNFNTGNCYNPDITVENGKVYVVWEDNNDTNGAGNDIDIFFLTNLTGSGWEPVQIISEPLVGQDINIRDSKNPCIKVNNGNIYVVWDDANVTYGAGLDPDIFYRCNLTGTSWEQIQIVSEPVPFQDNNIGGSIVPRMAIDNNDLHLVWMDYNNTYNAGTDTDIFYTNNISGSGWSQVKILSEPVPGQNFDTAHSTSSCIAVDNNKVYVAWHSNNETNGAGLDQDIFYKEFDGTSWLDVEIISEPVSGQNFNTGISMIPCIDAKSGNIYVVWADTNNTNGAGTDLDIFYKYKMGGSNWEDVQVISEPVPGKDFNTGGNSGEPKIIEHNDRLHVFWRDNNNTNGAGGDTDIFYKYTYGSLKLLSPTVTPISGNTSAYFNFTVKYFHKENTTPTQIVVNISGTEHSMIEVDTLDTNYIDGKDYFLNITHLDIGVHTFKCRAFDKQPNRN